VSFQTFARYSRLLPGIGLIASCASIVTTVAVIADNFLPQALNRAVLRASGMRLAHGGQLFNGACMCCGIKMLVLCNPI